MIKSKLAFFTMLIISCCAMNNVLAHENETHYDRIHLSANASAQLENDTMVATVYAQEEGSEAAELANAVNARIRSALDLVKKYPRIKHQTNSYASNPVYSNNKIKGWRVRQSLRLESQDMALMSDVLGKLQGDLALQSIEFSVSPQRRNQEDEKLIDKALEEFENRAMQVVKKLKRKSYKIVDINIATSGSGVVRPYQVRAMAMDSMESSPVISAGEQTVSVTVSGNIELE